MKDNKQKVSPFNILPIEDNHAHAELMMRSLENHQIANKIHRISDGEAALDYLFRRGAPPKPIPIVKVPIT